MDKATLKTILYVAAGIMAAMYLNEKAGSPAQKLLAGRVA